MSLLLVISNTNILLFIFPSMPSSLIFFSNHSFSPHPPTHPPICIILHQLGLFFHNTTLQKFRQDLTPSFRNAFLMRNKWINTTKALRVCLWMWWMCVYVCVFARAVVTSKTCMINFYKEAYSLITLLITSKWIRIQFYEFGLIGIQTNSQR